MNEHRYKSEVLNAISMEWGPQGSTDTAAAISMMMSNMFTSSAGDRPNRPDISIVITDGRSADRYVILDLITFV